MSILVTGGAGFIGSNFVTHWLSSRQDLVVNLDALTYAGRPENLRHLGDNSLHHFVAGSISDSDLVSELLRLFDVTAIVHFAAESHVDRSISGVAPFVETNVVGVYRLLEAARRHFEGLPSTARDAFRFLHVSTDEVYGTLEPEDTPFTEDHPYRPNSPYAASKAASNHWVRAYNQTYGLPTLTTNCSNNYGPHQFPEKLIPVVIASALAGRGIPVYGDGKQVRDWLYVADHCTAIERVLSAGKVGESYNIGGSCEKFNIDVVLDICELLDRLQGRPDGRSYREQVTNVNDRLGHDRRYAIDSSKIQRELGWKPATEFPAGLEHTVRWYLSNLEWALHATPPVAVKAIA